MKLMCAIFLAGALSAQAPPYLKIEGVCSISADRKTLTLVGSKTWQDCSIAFRRTASRSPETAAPMGRTLRLIKRLGDTTSPPDPNFGKKKQQ